MTGSRLVASVLDESLFPPEPGELRCRIRAEVIEDPGRWAELASDGRWIAEPVWALAQADLESRGVTGEDLARSAEDYSYELWLWVMGERLWTHCFSGLLGRAYRRVGIAATGSGTQTTARVRGANRVSGVNR